MVVIRRFLLTGVGSSTVTSIAVIMTGVEETFFRATLVSRDYPYPLPAYLAVCRVV